MVIQVIRRVGKILLDILFQQWYDEHIQPRLQKTEIILSQSFFHAAPKIIT